MENKSITIHYGSLAKPLFNQLDEQEIKLDKDELMHFQKDIDALNRIRIRGYLTPSQADSANKRLHNRIMKQINLEYEQGEKD